MNREELERAFQIGQAEYRKLQMTTPPFAPMARNLKIEEAKFIIQGAIAESLVRLADWVTKEAARGIGK